MVGVPYEGMGAGLTGHQLVSKTQLLQREHLGALTSTRRASLDTADRAFSSLLHPLEFITRLFYIVLSPGCSVTLE